MVLKFLAVLLSRMTSLKFLRKGGVVLTRLLRLSPGAKRSIPSFRNFD